ncbi:MAG: bifunctional phosphoribosylaminoimidazolecarboxamide formyltransferase/IMP cyclohydrolase [Sphingobacteriales bacterium SCN 48-20]|uniref:bifunctional phosphoribosylaminoimidazolecarboxamide formyltransferase/IMP cyclohydrolase n=1 Tax=Terrimonas ferruginea TaxID=249 RepID=UPI00086EE591|nr:bifunctional phosphoribosylaminoimidazolecarboxamide formyltransferase/IMP cyclohydrolase [Terrimonas ferruginea]MBN8782239.1 bifunctional phosphoribosylaminoimidazolecarboxamide formyltransferase/IMP cyclohydrolase [Terrimonas ferruginea]ODT92272.1 MAG: bifunctional phosphoribosylaminoimidazolecarboxamide formyltransferase/IMP cyclohydrolase [Sphingobacteriales bacterium SCN 48-20]OJW42770.1 MAG: bifunctional phosphoribosylaminoimidazolecarboxamide formyltransferase/IMP cyclohydrolase [Sphin
MNKKVQTALISVFYKDGLEPIVRQLHKLGTTIYSTGGTQTFIEQLGIPVVPVEQLTSYPSILGGRVKTLHPLVFGGILGKRDDETHLREMKEYGIPELDLVIVDLYPFEETVASTSDEKQIIEKIDIGGPSMIRAAAKNFRDVLVVAAKKEYAEIEKLLTEQNGETSIEQRKAFAAKAFEVVAHYDVAIAKYFNPSAENYFLDSVPGSRIMRYGENPHQTGVFYGDLDQLFTQLNGKELSYNNLVDVDAAVQLIKEFSETTFAIIKHTNVCGVAARNTVKESWDTALAGDPESAFGGVLVTNGTIDKATAEAINEIFFEVLIAPAFDEDALEILRSKKNRILLQLKQQPVARTQYKSLLNGVLAQGQDEGNYAEWKEAGGRETTEAQRADLDFANLVCKHLKSNAIALVKNKQLVGKGCGQTSRIDSLRQAVEKAKQFKFDLNGAVLASDAFFPFNDCVQLGHEAGIQAFIQPGGSIRDKDSIEYAVTHQLAMVITGMRHFRH